MKKDLLKVSLRNQAVFLADEFVNKTATKLNESTSMLVANAHKRGFTFSEDLLQAINGTSPAYKLDVLTILREVTGVNKNWTPLVKGWNVPTGESVVDHVVTFFANLMGSKDGTTLACGHLIPNNTFPLERYNGCPFCGTPFEFGELVLNGQGSKLKVLELWKDADLQNYFNDLLASKTALDATQVDSLKLILAERSVPQDVIIKMKETLMLVIDQLIALDKADEVSYLFSTPNDVLRYLWFKHTGFLQIVEPAVVAKRKGTNSKRAFYSTDKSTMKAALLASTELKLKYNRSECRRVASWLNALEMNADKACEIMHPKRGMWVRFIRALRLMEYSKKKGFERLAILLETFHAQTYTVTNGRLNHYRLRYDANNTFAILKKRPGLFSRSLFSNMLWFGADETLKHFGEIAEAVPARLLLTLNMYSKIYFDKDSNRLVKPLGGTAKRIPGNKFVQIYDVTILKTMQEKIELLCLDQMKQRFSKVENENKTMFIEDILYKMPLSIGERGETIQDLPSAMMGTRFPVEGSTVRLFMQWGVGLKAQHLDMDLSCIVAYADRAERCSYSQLTIKGCKHSGDILEIPNKVGTAEYIDVNVEELAKTGARFVSFTCNAYSEGALAPNLVVGWMNSRYPMEISKTTGVAYDPSCVQYQARITQGLTKGLVFGVLDVAMREIVWMEMSFGGQIVQNLDLKNVKVLLSKLDSRMNIGSLLALKAEAQGLTLVDEAAEADEVYDSKWGVNAAGVTALLLD